MGDRARIIIHSADYRATIYTHNYGQSVPAMLQIALEGAILDEVNPQPASIADYLVDYANYEYSQSPYYNASYPAWRRSEALDENHAPFNIVLGASLEDAIVYLGYESRQDFWAPMAEYVRLPDEALPGGSAGPSY